MGGVWISPRSITCTVVDEPSVSSPFSSRMVSNAPASTASFFEQHVRKERGRLDVASRPAQVGGGDGGDAILQQRRGDGVQNVREGEYRRRELRGPRVIAAGLRAARHLKIDVLITAAVADDECLEDLAPFGMRCRCRHANAGETPREPVEVLAEAERTARVHRYDLIHRIAEQERTVERRDAGLRQGKIFTVQVADGEGH